MTGIITNVERCGHLLPQAEREFST